MFDDAARLAHGRPCTWQRTATTPSRPARRCRRPSQMPPRGATRRCSRPTFCWRFSSRRRGWRRGCSPRSGRRSPVCSTRCAADLERLPRAQGGAEPVAVPRPAPGARRGRQAGAAVPGRLRLGGAPAARHRRACRAARPPRSSPASASPGTRCCAPSRSCAARHRVTDDNPEGKLEALQEVRPRPHRAGASRQARPGDRPRRRDPPRHAGAHPPHQEQPGADRRARGRQDRRRRGAGAAHRRRRRPGAPQASAASSPSTWGR